MLTFTKLCVTDIDRSAEWYESILGLREFARYRVPGLSEVTLQSDGSDPMSTMSLTLMQWDPAKPVVVGHEHGRLGVITSDVEAYFARARSLGGRVIDEPKAMPEVGVKVGFLADPDGYAIEVVELLPAK